jgi:hypothetical protein
LEKEKVFQNIEFSAHALRTAKLAAEETYADGKLPEGSSTHRRISMTSKENWTFDSDEEFYAGLRSPHDHYTFNVVSPDISLRVFFYGSDSTVSVDASDRAGIESIFEIFEVAASQIQATREASTEKPKESIEPPKFILERRLPSCAVDTDLIGTLEQYIFNELPGLLALDRTDISRNYSLTVYDPAGSMQLASLGAYPAKAFADGTKRITLDVAIYSTPSFILRLVFDKERTHTTLSLSLTAPNAVETAQGIADRLLRLVGTRSNLNWLFNPPLEIGALLSGGGSIAYIIYLIYLIAERPPLWPYLLGSLVLLGAVLLVGKRAHPYVAFDTPGECRWTSFWTWLFWGSLGVLLFETVFVLLRDKLAGLWAG